MKTQWMLMAMLMICGLRLGSMTARLGAQSSESPPPSPRPRAKLQVEDKDRVTLDVARDRAKVMHDIYSATLDVIHHRYFEREKAVIPARAMEDVFKEMRLHYKVEANWISVNLKAMSIDHDPKTDFEKEAAAELATGKPEFERVENGYYRRAMPIPLSGGCISCHAGFFRDVNSSPKYAGLVISIPIHQAESNPAAE